MSKFYFKLIYCTFTDAITEQIKIKGHSALDVRNSVVNFKLLHYNTKIKIGL